MTDSEEKRLAPTPHKLRQARKRGEIARSKDLITATVSGAALLVLFIVGPTALASFEAATGEVGQMAGLPYRDAIGPIVSKLGWIAFKLLTPLILFMIVAATLTAIVVNGGVLSSLEPLLPKLDRIDPMKGFGRLFAVRNLVEVIKGAAKLLAIFAVVWFVMRSQVEEFGRLPFCGIGCVPAVTRRALLSLFAACCLALLLFGLLDVGLQRWLFRRDMRMTRTEHKRDRKDSDGDPHLAAHRKKERREMAQLGARTGLRHATFIVQSADDALGFRYGKPDATVPILVARRRQQDSLRLVAEARRLGLPVVVDPEAVAALRRIEVGKMVPRAAFSSIIRVMKTAGVIG